MKNFDLNKKDIVPLIGISTIAGFIASLCCIAPVILVFFGLSSISFAAALHINLETNYKLALMIAGFVTLFLGIRFYFLRNGEWTTAKMTRIYNYLIVGIVLFIVAYLFIHNFIAYTGIQNLGIAEAAAKTAITI